MDLFNFSSWNPLTTLAVGAIAGVLVFWTSQLLLRRRPEAEGPPEDYEERKPAHGSEGHGPEGPDQDSPSDLFVGGRNKERRAALRRAGNAIPIYIADEKAEAEPITGWVLDRSTGGLCMSVEVEIEPNTVLSVRTRNAPESIPWWQIEVKSCRKSGKEYELGCMWVRTPPWSVLLLFG